ncbi:YeiH family protein [Glutamicibacter sp. V16R2B1]|uniref:YeiH family protein n=1 Tax=Glutamicibacter sp. V16R2B1 TaxID=2036207 RepID=UPI0010FE54B2|nr:YeiH family protein [Glutamicibacter sp. V16R2B1]TLK48767.1 YeiH family putative sulfate export transporter [Glutamicibacter sp. V16R2B1]
MAIKTDQVRQPATHKATGIIRPYLPGLLLCAVAVVISMGINKLLPGVSALIVAIVLGITLTNVIRLPESTMPGITFASKKLLRLGIVFLGLQLVLSDIISLGAPMLLVIVCIVGGGIFSTLLIGRLMKMRAAQVLLIACGFSICGAAAVAGVEGVTDSDEEDVVTAVALVVIFGTLMIPAVPFLGQVLGMSAELNGMWAGASIHEIAQVVAAGGIIGGGALAAAVIAKLARILMLAPVVAVLSVRQRRRGNLNPEAKRPPIVPLFIIGFLAMILIRSFCNLPQGVIDAGSMIQTALLSAAMFGLGCGVKIRNLMNVGVRPFILAAISTLIVAGIAYAGIILVH